PRRRRARARSLPDAAGGRRLRDERTKVLHEEKQLVWVRRRLLEVVLLVERARLIVESVDQDGAGADDQCCSHSLALESQINGQPGEQDDGDGIAAELLPHLLGGLGELDARRGEAVVATYDVASRLAGDVRARSAERHVREGVPAQPVVHLGLPARELAE